MCCRYKLCIAAYFPDAYLVRYGIFQEGSEDCFEFNIVQGEAIKREGTMHVRVEKRDGEPVLVQIIGSAVIAFSTEMIL
jgi:predicted PhzF superfamily epimerase YddE/YHI9